MLNFTAPSSFLPSQAGPAPAWADPRALMAQTAFRETILTVNAGFATKAVPADPKRVAIGVMKENVMGGDGWFGPNGGTQAHGWYITAFSSDNWFTIFQHGAMVNEAWYVFDQNGFTYRILEIYRLN